MFACVLTVDLRIPLAGSLKQKRAVITPILEGSHRRFRVAVSEVGQQDQTNRSELSFATVASKASIAQETLDTVERFVWSFPEVEVLDCWRSWLDTEEEQR